MEVKKEDKIKEGRQVEEEEVEGAERVVGEEEVGDKVEVEMRDKVVGEEEL